MYYRKSIRFVHLPDDHSGIARSNVVCDRVKKNVRKPGTQLSKRVFLYLTIEPKEATTGWLRMLFLFLIKFQVVTTIKENVCFAGVFTFTLT